MPPYFFGTGFSPSSWWKSIHILCPMQILWEFCVANCRFVFFFREHIVAFRDDGNLCWELNFETLNSLAGEKINVKGPERNIAKVFQLVKSYKRNFK